MIVWKSAPLGTLALRK